MGDKQTRMTNQTPTMTQPAAGAAVTDHRAGKYLAFHLGAEEFGLPVLSVREIMGLQDITAVPQTPAHVRGVINLRGKVIPVVDLRLKFGLPSGEYGQRTSIIVVKVDEVMMGVIVDGVSEVLNLSSGDIENTPDFGRGIETPYILGMAKTKGKVRMLLDIEQILSSQDISGFSELLQ
jgi:purine-binding chemotaxis protein CheW